MNCPNDILLIMHVTSDEGASRTLYEVLGLVGFGLGQVIVVNRLTLVREQ